LCWDGRTALAAGGSGSLSVWDLHSGAPVATMKAVHSGPVTCAAVSNDGRVLVTGGEDRKVVVLTNKSQDSWED